MTKEEWINNDLDFYHITHTRNLENIYLHGLQSRNGLGICVVRSNDKLIIQYICETMLNVDDDVNFSIIRILPSSIQLLASEVINDNVVECTNPLHNYIVRNSISVTSSDVVGTYQANPLGIENIHEFEMQIKEKTVLDQLD